MKIKMKSRKTATRRFKVTAGGKILHRRSFRRHLAANKSKRQKNNKEVPLTGSNLKKIRKIMGVKK